jgi:hypothetical protein
VLLADRRGDRAGHLIDALDQRQRSRRQTELPIAENSATCARIFTSDPEQEEAESHNRRSVQNIGFGNRQMYFLKFAGVRCLFYWSIVSVVTDVLILGDLFAH